VPPSPPRRPGPLKPKSSGDSEDEAITFGWRVHEAVQSWTESVDVKASIVLVAEIALASAGVKSLITQEGELHNVAGVQLGLAIGSCVLLAAAVAALLWVVFPRLGGMKGPTGHPHDIIYFGHLRSRTRDEIDAVLASLTAEDQRRQLARQLKTTGEVAWRKHVWLRVSIALFALGSLLLVLSFVGFSSDETDPPEAPRGVICAGELIASPKRDGFLVGCHAPRAAQPRRGGEPSSARVP